MKKRWLSLLMRHGRRRDCGEKGENRYKDETKGMTKKMKVERCVKESFVVIGKEGSTLDGEGFIQRLWVDANSHFGEVQHLAKKDENGNISGIWGAMSDFSRSFNPDRKSVV